MIADGLGYNTSHGYQGNGIHGTINPGHGNDANGASGAGHGGSGGRGSLTGGTPNTGFAYGDLYEPYIFGSAGGKGSSSSRGGNGGGMLWMNVTGLIDIDGLVSANGEDATSLPGSGGGSGGSIWMYCKKIKGYGRIAANGGAGSPYSGAPGGGGAGGRIAIYFEVNETSTYFVYEARGGAALGCQIGREDLCNAEPGGPGTVFLYHMIHTHRTLLIHNGGQKPLVSAIADYKDLTRDGCRAWILPQSANHDFAGKGRNFHFEELQIYGGGHLALLTEPVGRNASLFFRYMIGDRNRDSPRFRKSSHGFTPPGNRRSLQRARLCWRLPRSGSVHRSPWCDIVYLRHGRPHSKPNVTSWRCILDVRRWKNSKPNEQFVRV